MDVQGADAAIPYVRKAGVTFPVLVDQENHLGSIYGMTKIPTTFLVDEVGIVRAVGWGPEPEFLKELETILEESPASPGVVAARAAARPEVLPPAAAPAPANATSAALVAEANALIRSGRKEDATARLRQALAADPDNWIIRKQIWAIEHPDRFYSGAIDTAWQKEVLKREIGNRP